MDDETLKLVQIITQAVEYMNPGETKAITCPFCGGEMMVSRAALNGHVRAVCDGCGRKIIQ